MNLVLVGTSHHHAPVEVRERVALDGTRPRRWPPTCGRGLEAVCLSTCNRTELYLVGDDAEARAEAALRRAGRRRPRPGALPAP